MTHAEELRHMVRTSLEKNCRAGSYSMGPAMYRQLLRFMGDGEFTYESSAEEQRWFFLLAAEALESEHA